MPTTAELDTLTEPRCSSSLPPDDDRRPTLLIVDDEDGPRQSLRIVFKDDFKILMANCGSSAMEIARNHPIDAAVLDIRMEDMSGTDLLIKLKEIDSSIQVIMLTAYETYESARKALRSGACDYLNKPFDISTIRAAVANAMERRSLAKEIHDNNGSLKELKTELEDKKLQEEIARTRGEIYASVIHDINGPLTIISGFLDVLNQRIGKHERVEGEDLEFLKDRLTRITRQVHNCVQISRRYLSFLREKTSDQPPVGVNQILIDLGELLKPNPDVQKNQLIIHLLAEDVVADINGTDLMQILLNLIVNALQCSTEPHRVEVHGERLDQPLNLELFAESPELRFINRDRFENTAPMVAISVEDDGPGIPAELTDKIFETGFTTKPGDKGTGLGLSIVKRLVREGKGAICLKTTPSSGTAFTVYLPAHATTPDQTIKG